MASERDEALNAVVATEITDQDLSQSKILVALHEAEVTKRLELSHAHALTMRKAELGWFGRALGGESNAAVVIAFFVVVLGFSVAIGLWITAAHTGQYAFWSSEAHMALGAATTALGYVFGRGSKDKS